MAVADPTPARVAETITRLDKAADAPLNAYWLSIIGDRGEYASRLQPLLRDRGIGVLIVRSNGFTNPNALMGDLVELLEQNRVRFLEALAHHRRDPGQVGVVLLARRELAMGQAYSPAIWPEWVPGVGKREITCFITDVTRRIEVRFDAEEVDVARVRSALHAVEEALVRRLVVMDQRTPQDQNDFFQLVRRKSDAGWASFLAGACRAAAEVRHPQAYRAEVREGRSVVGRLCQLSEMKTPAELVGARSALASALGIVGEAAPLDPWDGLIATLNRPHIDRSSPADRLCHSIFSTVAVANQLINCFVHADRHQAFPVNLLVAFVDDIHHALVGIETFLNHLSDERAEQLPA